MALTNVTRLFIASVAPARSPFVTLTAARPFSCLVRSPVASVPEMAPPPSLQPSRTFHTVGKPKRRCGSCWIEIIDERMHVFCNRHPRHRQASKLYRPKRGEMILTHATQGSAGFRGNGKGKSRMNTQAGFRLDF